MADSTILVKSPDGWKVKVAFGIFGLAVIVILAFLYRVEVGIITLAIGLGVGARVGVWAWQQYNLADHQRNLADIERRRLLADIIKAEAEAKQAEARTYFIETNTGVFVLDGIAISQFYPAVQASKWLADAPALLPEPEPRLRRLLDIKFEHMLIVGPSGSGKTTALCHLIENAPPNALVYVLDPHAQFSQWPERVNEVVGIGRDYEAINTRLAELITIMDRRYNGLEAVTTKVLIVADEWLIIRDKCSNAERFFTEVGSEARKVNLSLIISSISSILDDLAVSGAIRDNFAQLGLNRTLKDKNHGELKWSRRDTELVELPGRYRGRGWGPGATKVTGGIAARGQDFITEIRPEVGSPRPPSPDPLPIEPLPVLDNGPAPLAPTEDELRVFELHQQGKLPYAIFKELYPDRTYGGNQANEIKAVLARFGVML